jgi:hypothetical protein
MVGPSCRPPSDESERPKTTATIAMIRIYHSRILNGIDQLPPREFALQPFRPRLLLTCSKPFPGWSSAQMKVGVSCASELLDRDSGLVGRARSGQVFLNRGHDLLGRLDHLDRQAA